MNKVLTLDDLKLIRPESTLFLETKQTLRPAFFMGVIDRSEHCKESRFAIHLMTASKIAKYWEWRLYNKTWRLWIGKPTRHEQLEVKWDEMSVQRL